MPSRPRRTHSSLAATLAALVASLLALVLLGAAPTVAGPALDVTKARYQYDGHNKFGTWYVCKYDGYLYVKVTKERRTTGVTGKYVRFYFSKAGLPSKLKAQVPLRTGSPRYYKSQIRATGYHIDLGRKRALGAGSFNSSTIRYNVPRC